MGDILIVGGGFAGLETARLLSRKRARLGHRRIFLVDRRKTSDFLPLLPDLAAGRVSRDSVTLDLERYLEKIGINFELGEVERIDPDKREVFLKEKKLLGYEFLVLACGSETNFFGLKEVQERAFKIDSAQDALLLGKAISAYPEKEILVVGAGYTGLEIATSLVYRLRRQGARKHRVSVIERDEEILKMMPRWIQDYGRMNLCAMRINLYTGCSVRSVTEDLVKLSNGLEFRDCLLVWTAGVTTPLLVQNLPFRRDKQGRLLVDSRLSLREDHFAIGDVASFEDRGRTVRMAVQFALAQAGVVAENIARICCQQKRLKRFKPGDLGYLLPLANRRASGKILFFRAWGFGAWMMHYALCLWRSWTWKNRWGIVRDLLLFFRFADIDQAKGKNASS